MPPKAANPQKHKGPAFKPPRPVKASAETKKAPAATASRSAQAAPSRPAYETALIISSSEDEDENQDPLSNDDADPDADEVMEDGTGRPGGGGRETFGTPQLNPIPENLLARLLYHGFEDKNTVIQKGALELTAKYMDTFVREAIARAADERKDARKGSGHMDGYLQVEDLEKLAPQLVLDF